MRVIGITGGIGSGKSTVARLLSAKYDIPLIDADKLSKQATEDIDIKNKIREEFGQKCFDKDFNLIRNVVAELIFSDVLKVEKLNSIIHPYVRNEFKKLIKYYEENNDYVLYDVPLLFEARLEKDVDFIVLVYLDYDTRINRLVNRGMTKDDAVNRISKQISLDDKIKLSDLIVYNNASLPELENSLGLIYDELK